MQIVRANDNINVSDSAGRAVYSLRAGTCYALHDSEVASALRGGSVEWVATLDSRLRMYAGQTLSNERLVLPFIGRLGDALVTASCLQALCEVFPGVTIDIACASTAREVFELCPNFGELLSYPIADSQLAEYDFYMSFEDVASISRGSQRSMFDLFSRCLNTPKPSKPVSLCVPESAKTTMTRVLSRTRPPLGPPLVRGDQEDDIATTAKSGLAFESPDTESFAAAPDDAETRAPASENPTRCVAVQIGDESSLRSYPADLTAELIKRLSDEGFAVTLIGESQTPTFAHAAHEPRALACADADRDGCYKIETSYSEALPPATVLDLRGQTETVAELAATIEQMDIVITGDSFLLHLAGSLGVPTVAIFAPTDAVTACDYPTAAPLTSNAKCSPCGVAFGACPEGHKECIAHRDKSLSPQAIVDRVIIVALRTTEGLGMCK